MAILLIIIIFIILCYLINKVLFSYWSHCGIAQENNQKLFFGDLSDSLKHKKSIAENLRDIYERNKHHDVFGIYVSYRPFLMINNPKIIRDIMLKDSNYFPDRGTHVDKSFDPLSDQLFFQGGKKWKTFRSNLTSAFTAGKMKSMLPITYRNLEILKTFIKQNLENGKDIFEFRDLIARLNTNNICAVAFGIDVETINNPQHIMRQMGVKVFEPNLIAGLRFFTSIFTPIINKIFRFKIVNSESENFFRNIIQKVVELRETNKNQEQNDLMQKLINLKDEGFKNEDIYAQAFGFYLGGFETTSTTVGYCLYELARNLDIQRICQEEIDMHFKITDNNDDNYEMIKKLTYLGCCAKETLRKYTPLPVLNRICTRDYHHYDTSVFIKKNTPVLIPIFALHRDKEIFENPLKFNPDRFLNNSRGSEVDGLYYMPFGEGQRICIGHRMGKQNVILQLATLLSCFNFHLINEENSEELEFNPKQLFLQPIGNINLRVSLRK